MEKTTFLQTLKKVFEQLKKDGIVTQEDIDKGFKIPIEWLSSNEEVSREAITETLSKLRKTRLEKFSKENSAFIYTENNGVPYLESRLGNGTIIIADQYNIQLNQSRNNYGAYLRLFLSEEFIRKNINK